MSNLFYPLVDATFKYGKFLIGNWKCLPTEISYPNIKEEYRIGDMSIPIGVSKSDIIYLNIGQKNVNTIICGMCGYGKSNLLNSIICSICKLYPNTFLYLYDPKAVELSQYSSLANVTDFQYESNCISKSLEAIYEAIKGTYDTMRIEGKRIISPLDKRTVVIIDELSLLNRKKDIPVLERCMSIGRACGYYFILSSQRVDSNNIISPIIRNLLDTIVTFKLDNNTSKLILGNENAIALDTVGRFIIKTDNKQYLGQSYYISQEQINNIISKRQVVKEAIVEDNNTNWIDNL